MTRGIGSVTVFLSDMVKDVRRGAYSIYFIYAGMRCMPGLYI